MAEDTLERLGLSPGEAKAYRALLGLGASSIGPIASKSGVSRSKIYEVLEKLSAKGLVSVVFSGKKRLFKACRPTMLLELVEKKKREIEREESEVKQIIPELLQLRTHEKQIVELFEGFNGLKTIREEMLAKLKKGDELLILGAPRQANERWEGWLLDYHARREKRGIGMRIIYNADTRDYGRKRKKFKLTRVRYLPEKFVTPTWFDVFNDNVLIVILPKGEKPYALLIRDKSVADSVKAYFELLWNISKK